MQGRCPRGLSFAGIRRILVALAFATALVTTTAPTLTAGTVVTKPGPAPIVVSGSGSAPIRVSQYGRERVVAPPTHATVITGRSVEDSAFDVPEPGSDSLEAEEFAEEPEFADQGGQADYEEWREPSGYESSSTLNQRLPGAEHDPFSEGYASSSSLNERMAAQASSQGTAWPTGDVVYTGTVQQWSTRGSASRRGSR